MKKNFLFLFIILTILFCFLYFVSFFYLKKIHGLNNLELIKYKNQISFIEKYSKRLHHLRHYLDKSVDFKKTETLLFSKGKYNNNNNLINILFLGDSWIEQMLGYQQSHDHITNYFKEKKINYYNAGISSYSPTIMNIQYQILKNDFDLKPKIVVLYIDQTDFGDEICRYKKNKKFVDGKLYSVRDYLFTPRSISMSKIDMKYSSPFLKDIAQFNFYIEERFFLLILSMIGISVNAAEKISGSVMLTGGRTTIGPNSDDYSFNDFHLTGNIILNDSYFASLTHSNQKHSSTGKNHKHKFYWTKVGYQIPLSNILEVNSLDTMKVFASIGYFT